MTTKKQRRAHVAAKTSAERESLRQENLALLKRSKDREEQRRWEAERAAKKREASAKIKAMAEKRDEPLPENLAESFAALQQDLSDDLKQQTAS